MPNIPEQYVHRIGRTARAGRDGIAISYVAGEEKGWLKQIERLTKVQLMPLALPEDFDAKRAKLPKPAPQAAEPRRENSGGRGRAPEPRGEGERAHRPFRHRRPGGVGAHKGAVRHTSGGR